MSRCRCVVGCFRIRYIVSS